MSKKKEPKAGSAEFFDAIAPDSGGEGAGESTTDETLCPECGGRALDFRGTDEIPTHYLCEQGHEWTIATDPPPDPACVLACDILAILAESDGDRGRVRVAARCQEELEGAGAEVPAHRARPRGPNTPFDHERPRV